MLREMSALKNIFTGWTKKLHLVETTQGEKRMALERVKICVDCPHAKEQWATKIIDGVLKNDELGSGIGCGLCGCPVQAKALVENEKCPLDKW